ncbi:hypothetical protein WG904_07365 [Pedobacter sp. Du54]|uniref:hypothetical protein n=1 Tax=Pedobacter anseongensis TaxID=3133439 RepID=UPI0030993166
MDIVSYLLELIETRKNVGITALGTLYKKKTPGRYDSETHSFLPPKYEIAFTSEVKEDKNLINFISEKRNIAIESADYYITEFVETIKAQLAEHQQADLSPLGKLKLINDDLVLESSHTLEIGFASYGLPNVSTEQNQPLKHAENTATVLEEVSETHQPAEADEQPVFDEIADVNTIQEANETEERIDIEQESEKPTTELPSQGADILDPLWKPTVINRYEYDEEDDDEGNRWVRKTLKVILTLIIILVAIGTFVYFLYPNLYYTIKEKFAAIEVGSEPVAIADTSTNRKIDSPKVDSLKNTPIISINRDTIVTPQPVNTIITYEIIGSAMKTQKKVDEVISRLAKRGITAKKMDAMPGRLIKISLGTFTDYNQAKKFQDSLKIKLKNPEIYIQTIKPKN